jgi:glutathione S-transferase
MKLVIGNTNYSTWSLRAWMAAKASGLEFEEVVVDLDAPETASRIGQYSGAGRVPVLVDGDVTVWDSLSIVEYLAEIAPDAALWPRDRAARAHARSAVAEMHVGFAAMRAHYPMNLRRAVGARPPDAAADRDVARVCALWREARQRFGAGGPYLYGAFTAADAYFAPVASRFRTYSVSLAPVEAEYRDVVLAHPAMVEWTARAKAETWVVHADEVD